MRTWSLIVGGSRSRENWILSVVVGSTSVSSCVGALKTTSGGGPLSGAWVMVSSGQQAAASPRANPTLRCARARALRGPCRGSAATDPYSARRSGLQIDPLRARPAARHPDQPHRPPATRSPSGSSSAHPADRHTDCGLRKRPSDQSLLGSEVAARFQRHVPQRRRGRRFGGHRRISDQHRELADARPAFLQQLFGERDQLLRRARVTLFGRRPTSRKTPVTS